MFGKNPIRSAESDPLRLAITSIFYTLQGEGPFSGEPALFIRLAGCNLACHFCDTAFDLQEDGGPEITALPLTRTAEIMERIERDFSPQQRHLVVLTGGEPMRQNFMGLLGLLFASGTHTVQIETAGTLWVDGLEKYIEVGEHDPGVDIVCSPKTPRVNINIRAYCCHWKYIIRAGELGEDGLPRRGTQMATRDSLSHIFRPVDAFADLPEEARGTIWVSPCDDYDPEKNAANLKAAVESAMKHGYRLSLQVHKIAGVE